MSNRAVRKPRADSRRNHKHLIDVAHEVFTEGGPEAPLEEVARRAKVGIGTLYRHFPTRLQLIEEVYSEQTAALLARADELKRSLPPGEALFAWLRASAEHMTKYRALKVCLIAAGEGKAGATANWKDRMIEAIASLLRAAESVNAVRNDITPGDLLSLVHGVVVAAERADDPLKKARTLIDIMAAGLKPEAPGK